jgi:hypothetical protein
MCNPQKLTLDGGCMMAPRTVIDESVYNAESKKRIE